MKILAIETTGQICSVAIVSQSGIIGEYTLKNTLTHSENLLPIADNLLKTTGTILNEITHIAVSSGPGSFTGLRIGFACAKGLAHGTNSLIIEVPTLDALAYNVFDNKSLIVPIMDARRNQVYAAYYAHSPNLKRYSDYLAMDIDEVIDDVNNFLLKYGISKAIFLGDGVDVYREKLRNHFIAPISTYLQRASSVGSLALNISGIPYQKAVPTYLKKPLALRQMSDVKIVPLLRDHIDDIYKIETESFSLPWSKNQLYDELENQNSIYIVALINNEVVGYMGMWHIIDEGNITNIAVTPNRRQEGIAQKLLSHMENLAINKQIKAITLEVREGNTMAKNLYKKNGFLEEGKRKNYYKKPLEDAIIMWKKL